MAGLVVRNGLGLGGAAGTGHVAQIPPIGAAAVDGRLLSCVCAWLAGVVSKQGEQAHGGQTGAWRTRVQTLWNRDLGSGGQRRALQLPAGMSEPLAGLGGGVAAGAWAVEAWRGSWPGPCPCHRAASARRRHSSSRCSPQRPGARPAAVCAAHSPQPRPLVPGWPMPRRRRQKSPVPSWACMSEAVVPAGAAALLELHLTGREVELVVDGEDLVGRDLEEARQRRDRLAERFM